MKTGFRNRIKIFFFFLYWGEWNIWQSSEHFLKLVMPLGGICKVLV